MQTSTLYDIPVETIIGQPSSLAACKNKVLLVVNVASQCGLKRQVEAVQKLYSHYKDAVGPVSAGFSMIRRRAQTHFLPVERY